MKRFYKDVSIDETDEGFRILLDGKPVMTPARNPLVIPTRPLARMAETEWESQTEKICPESMHISSFLMTMIDRITPNRAQISEEIMAYLDTDLLCYNAEEPDIYATAQKECWSPFLTWINDFFAVEIVTTSGLSPITQEKHTREKISAYVSGLDNLRFSALATVTYGTGSILLGIAATENKFTPDDLFTAALIEDLTKDKIYMSDTYGISPDQERKRDLLRADLDTAQAVILSLEA